MRVLGVVALAAALCGCAIQRAQVAQDARVQMVGMSKEQVLACMGPPAPSLFSDVRNRARVNEIPAFLWAYTNSAKRRHGWKPPRLGKLFAQ
jgi:hypothetical protein